MPAFPSSKERERERAPHVSKAYPLKAPFVVLLTCTLGIDDVTTLKGFQEIFTSSMMAALEWGAFDYAKAVLDNYAVYFLRPVEINLLVFTENLLENTDGAPHQCSLGSGSLLPSIYADGRYIDDVIAIEGGTVQSCTVAWRWRSKAGC